ncbi:MAG: MarR family transcriptional regulator [Thermacetogeniaceae bacterium]
MKDRQEIRSAAESIREAHELITNCLSGFVRKESAGEDSSLPLDSLSAKQFIMVKAVKELTVIHPNGCSLKELAGRLGITGPSASVMVTGLVKKEILRRLASDSDRRGVHIQLAPAVADHFTALDRATCRHIMMIADLCGEELLLEWRDVLQQLRVAFTSLTVDEEPE